MIRGVGVDIVEIPRIKSVLGRFGDRFAKKILAASELIEFQQSRRQAAFLAKRFAAKEAVSKALGRGMSGGVHFHQIIVAHTTRGQPLVNLKGMAAEVAERADITTVHLSLSDEVANVIAFAVAEGP